MRYLWNKRKICNLTTKTVLLKDLSWRWMKFCLKSISFLWMTSSLMWTEKDENKWDKILLDDNKKHHPLCSSSFNHPLSHNHSTCKNIWPSGANPNWKNILVWFKSTILIRLDCFFVFDLDKMYFCRQGLFFYGV